MRQLVHILLLLLLAAPAARAGALDIQVDEDEIFQNEWVDLVVTVNADHVELVPPTSKDFKVEALRTGQPMFCMNIGYEVKSAPCRFAFRLTPEAAGRFETPAISLRGDGFFRPREVLKTSGTRSITVKAGKGDKKKRSSRGRVRSHRTKRRTPRGREPRKQQTERVFPPADLTLDASALGDLSALARYDAFTLTRPSHTAPYVSEPFAVEHLLYVDHRTVDALQEVSLPEPEGFRQEPLKTEIKEKGKETIGTRHYTVYTLGRSLLIPLETGTRVLPPPTAVVSVTRTTHRQGGGGFSISFSSGMSPREIRGPAVSLTVRPVPVPRSDGFRDGNVGSFEIRDVEVPEALDAGSWGFVKYVIKGKGNLYGLEPPPLPAPPGVTVREPSVDRSDVVVDEAGIHGEISVQVPFRAERTGSLDMGSLRLVTLDPETGAYATVTAPLGTVTLIRPAAAEVSAAVVDVGEAIRPVAAPDLSKGPNRPSTRPVPAWFLGILGAFIAMALLPWVARILRRRPVKGRSHRKALGRARRTLAELRRESLTSGAFYGALSRTMGDFLGSRFDLPATARSASSLEDALRSLGADDALLRALREELESCDYARFAPSAAQDADRSAAAGRIRDLMERLDTLRPKKGGQRHITMILAAAALFAASPAQADGDPENIWSAANDEWFAGRDAAALQRYEALLDQGLDNAALRYNLGTAALRLERFGSAIHQLKLALRSDPDGDLAADVEANLALARSALLERDRDRIEKGLIAFDESHGVWVTLFTLLPRTLVLVLALLLAGLFFPALGVMGLRRFSGLLGPARVVVWAALVPLVLVLALAAGRLWADATLRVGVVVSSDATLREAPNPAARGIPVAEGLEVRVLDKTPDDHGLLEVRIGDERDGWMTRSELGLL